MADAVEALPPPPPPQCGGGESGGGGGESGRSSPSPAASPEFEFWMVGKNPSSFQSPALLTADELFSGGVVLPLHNLQAQPSPADDRAELAAEEATDSAVAPAVTEEAEEIPETEGAAAQPLAESGIAPTPDLPAVTFKWKDIFKATNSGNGGGGSGEAAGGGKERKKTEKKSERRVSSVSGNAELINININIWPFSRSRSAGHGAAVSLSRAKPSPTCVVAGSSNAATNGAVVASNTAANGAASAVPAGVSCVPVPPVARKVSSAPCSRSNSRGESGHEPAVPPAVAAAAVVVEAAAGGHAAPSPGPTSMFRRLVPGGHNRNTTTGSSGTGIRLGRPSPVWQLRRNKLQQTAAEQKHASIGKKKAAPPAPAPAAGDGASTSEATPATETTQPSVSVGCRNNAAEGGGVEEGGPNPPHQGLFGLRTFFSKKVY